MNQNEEIVGSGEIKVESSNGTERQHLLFCTSQTFYRSGMYVPRSSGIPAVHRGTIIHSLFVSAQ